jgi:DNA-directed RNA polymerase specialized sigma24 family protein
VWVFDRARRAFARGPGGSFVGYYCTALRRAFREFGRRRRPGLLGAFEPADPKGESGISQLVVDDELGVLLADDTNRRRKLDAFTGVHFSEMTQTEVSRREGVAPSTVGKWLARVEEELLRRRRQPSPRIDRRGFDDPTQPRERPRG